jgi:uncharacterized protein (DUF1330 family)
MPGSIDPLREQFDAFKALPRDQPIQMLNLVRLKATADYPESHANHGQGMSGLDAYRAYGRETAALFTSLGGRQVWAGRPQVVVTGPADERWDLAFIAEYPNTGAFLAMVTDANYREWVKHRQAAVEDSRLIRLEPMTPGEGFGE